MIKNYSRVREIDDMFIRNNKITHKKALHIYEGMWKHAVNTGVTLLRDSEQEIREIVEFKKRINTGFSNIK